MTDGKSIIQSTIQHHFRPVLGALFFASLFINILSLAFPIGLLQIYDRVIPNENFSTLTFLVLGIVSALILEMILRIARSFISAWCDARFEHSLQNKVFSHLLKSQVREFENVAVGRHLERFNAHTQLRDFYAGQAANSIFDLPFVVIFLLMIAYIGGHIVIVPIVTLLILVLCTYFISKHIRNQLSMRRVIDEQRSDFTLEILRGIHTVKTLGLEAQMLNRYIQLQQRSSNRHYQLGMRTSIAQSYNVVISQVTIVSLVAIGAISVVNGNLSVGGLAACTLLVARCLQPVSRAMGVWTRLQSLSLAKQRLAQILTLPEDNEEGEEIFEPLRDTLVINGLNFQGAQRSEMQYEDLNLNMYAGSMIGLTGIDLSCYSNLFDVIMGIEKPMSGDIIFDGVSIDDIDITTLRENIGYIPNNSCLFAGSLLDNITLFQPELQSEAIKLIQWLGLDVIFDQMPDGYDTQIDDSDNITIPRGTKQRIVIARSLLKNPSLILFDAADKSVDLVTRKVINAMFKRLKGQTTIILASDNRELLEMCDKTYILRNNQLLEVNVNEVELT